MKKRICKIIMLLGMLVFCVGCGKDDGAATQEKEYVTENEENDDLENSKSTDGGSENDSADDATENDEFENNKNESGESEDSEDIEENEKEERIVLDTPTYIDASFLEMLGELTQQSDNDAVEILQPMINDKVLTDEELEQYLDNPDVAECQERMDEAKGGAFLQIDGDNDGNDDLIAWIYDGGSLGNSSRAFLQGQKDGSFKKTYENEGLSQELCFVEYDHKNYLLETDFDYNKKGTNGFIVSYYENGELYEMAYVNLVADSYVPEIAFVEEGYDKLAESTSELGKNGFLGENSHSWLVIEGSGEETVATPKELKNKVYEDTVFCSDLNNDGQTEWYTKGIFYPSNMSTILYLQNELFFADKKESVWIIGYYDDLDFVGIPLMYWVEHVEEKDRQIVCLLCYEGQFRNMVYGYLIEGENISKIMEIDYEGEEKIVNKIFTKGINLEYGRPYVLGGI
ncbi:MAG: hypothetical protein ACI4DK_08795 [Lachnospiraceae bacterium]